MKKIIKKFIEISMAVFLIFNLASYHYFLTASISWASEEVVSEETKEEQEQEEVEEEVVVKDEKEEIVEEKEESVENEEKSVPEAQEEAFPKDEELTSEELAEEEATEVPLLSEEEINNLIEDDSVNVNIAEKTENVVEVISDTGGNVVSGSENNDECNNKLEDLTAEELQESIEADESEEGNDEEAGDADENNCEEATDNEDVAEGLEEKQSPVENMEPLENSSIEEAEIISGNADAEAVILNEINTNITTENGKKEIINIEDGSSEDLNLVKIFKDILENSNENGEDGGIENDVTNINIATEVKNLVVVVAETGENVIKNIEEVANIETGNAEAVAGVINLINTNVVGNNWYLVVVNIVGEWTGDLIVPGEGLLVASDSGMQIDKVTNINEAIGIENSVVALANTGANIIEGAVDALLIKTGNAASSAEAFNLVNTNIVSNNWFFLIINNAGNWVGQVINWSEDREQQLVYEYDLGSVYTDPDNGNAIDVFNYNNATSVVNSVQAIADTGNNTISGAEDALITTGNASAWASVFNFINTNIVGNNWFFGIVNNLGDWSGDLVFAYPDLEVSIETNKDSIEPGDGMTYFLKYKNTGEADCQNVDLILSLPDYFSSQAGVAGFSSAQENDLFFSFPGLGAGEEKSFEITINSTEDIPKEMTGLISAVGIKTDTKEPETSNNYDTIETGLVFSEESAQPEKVVVENVDNDYDENEYSLNVERQENQEIALGELATYSILVENTGEHTLYNIEVKEKIRNPLEEVIGEYYWTVGSLEENQTALIEYQVVFETPAPLGTYNHRASAIGYTEYSDEIKSDKISSNIGLMQSDFTQGELLVEDEPEIFPVAEAVEMLPTRVLGVDLAEGHFNLIWLWILPAIIFLYFVKRKKLYQPLNWGDLIRRSAGFF